MIRTTLRTPWLALVAAALLLPSVARADDPVPPPPPPTYAPQNYPPPPPPGYPPPPPPTYAPPTYAPPTYAPPPTEAPPGYGPPGYTTQPYSAPIYAPAEISDFDDDAAVPPGYTKIYRARKGLIIGGSVTLGATYTVTLIAAAAADDIDRIDGTHTDYSAMWIPVAGPFLQLQRTDSSAGQFWLFSLGAGQAAGAVMLLYGLSNPRAVLVRNDQLSLGPMLGRGVSGLTLTGKF